MSLLFGPSRRDRRRAVQTLRELGPTSIPGLAAALSWSDRKTVRVLRQLASIPSSPVSYDGATRQIRAERTRPNPGISGAHLPLVPPPNDTNASTARETSTPEPVALPAAFRSLRGTPLTKRGANGSCPSCSSALELTATGEALVCRNCGRLSMLRPAAPVPPPAGSAADSPAAVVGSHPPAPDKKAQELFAAYVTSQPIPCPKCRIPMRHRSLGEYACPSCGQFVRFPSSPDANRAASGPVATALT